MDLCFQLNYSFILKKAQQKRGGAETPPPLLEDTIRRQYSEALALLQQPVHRGNRRMGMWATPGGVQH